MKIFGREKVRKRAFKAHLIDLHRTTEQNRKETKVQFASKILRSRSLAVNGEELVLGLVCFVGLILIFCFLFYFSFLLRVYSGHLYSCFIGDNAVFFFVFSSIYNSFGSLIAC